MGIVLKEFISSLKQGLYNSKPNNYRVYIDGSFFWHKGDIKIYKTQNDVEHLMASVAYNYILNILKLVYLHFNNLHPLNVYIYMDGERIENKRQRTESTTTYKKSLLVDIFVNLCQKNIPNCKIEQLLVGESELQMYKNRDISSDVNLFITGDTDMVSIMYGHRSKCTNFNLSDIQTNHHLYGEGIVDLNFTYPYALLQCNGVSDSCVWLKDIKDNRQFIGFDFSEDIINIPKRLFRIYIALCGTDFTNKMLTESMSLNFMNIKKHDLEHFQHLLDNNNNNNNLCDIVYGIIYVCCKMGKFTLPKLKKDQNVDNSYFSIQDMENKIKIYLDYIESGIMTKSIINDNNNNSIVCHKIVKSMTEMMSAPIIQSRSVLQWCNNNNFSTAIENVKKNIKELKIYQNNQIVQLFNNNNNCDDINKPIKRQKVEEIVIREDVTTTTTTTTTIIDNNLQPCEY